LHDRLRSISLTRRQLLGAAGLAMNLVIARATGFRHMRDIAPESVAKALKFSISVWPLSTWSLGLVKTSIALMLLRIKQVSRWRPGLIALIVVVTLASITSTVIALIQCQPLSAYWDLVLMNSGACWAPESLQIASYSYCGKAFTFWSLLSNACSNLYSHRLRMRRAPNYLYPRRSVPDVGEGRSHDFDGLGCHIGDDGHSQNSGIEEVQFVTGYVLCHRKSGHIFVRRPGDRIIASNNGRWFEISIGIIAACAPCLKVLVERSMRRISRQIPVREPGAARSIHDAGADELDADDVYLGSLGIKMAEFSKDGSSCGGEAVGTETSSNINIPQRQSV
jgi:hypothetical protein